MARLAESRLSINATTVGAVWVEGVHAEPSFEPRLTLRIGLELKEAVDQDGRVPPVRDYRLSDLRMQLRWASPGGRIIGCLLPCGGSQDLRSADYGATHQLSAAVPVSHAILEQIETERGEAPAKLVLEFWAAAVMSGELHQLHVQPVEFVVSHEEWGEFLRMSGFAEVDVLEVRRVGPPSEHLKRAVEHMREARAFILTGHLNPAVGKCRMALEAAATGLEGDPWKALKALAEESMGDRVGGEYSKMVSAIKQLSSETFHDYGADTEYGRAEAKFVVRITEDLVVLISVIRSHREGEG